MNASNVQVINRIEQNTLNIHEQQSANQTIMMNAIIDKIGKFEPNEWTQMIVS